VGPHYKCHGKKFVDIETALILILNHQLYPSIHGDSRLEFFEEPTPLKKFITVENEKSR
jgi:hypothetical protein